jgi:hypothetical protein
MGILDDAIRQHLDLKRQHGAAESELKQLEDEAFGPPGRPGDAEFPDSEESPEPSGNGAAADAGVAEAEPATDAPETGPEPSASEHPVVEPVPEAGEPAVGDEQVPEAPEGATESSEELTTVYDQTAEREPEVDQLEMEPEPAEPAESAAAPAPVESLDTVEHALPEEEEVQPEEPASEEPPPEPEGEPEEEQEGGTAEDDVLADTPEFLKDAPEDDELWFEQGEPKDFDF